MLDEFRAFSVVCGKIIAKKLTRCNRDEKSVSKIMLILSLFFGIGTIYEGIYCVVESVGRSNRISITLTLVTAKKSSSIMQTAISTRSEASTAMALTIFWWVTEASTTMLKGRRRLCFILLGII